MKARPVNSFTAGDYIGDMHDAHKIYAEFDVKERVMWDGPAVFNGANKELRVLGPASGLTYEGCIIAGYNYDNRQCGVLILGDKE